jgi:hypothetical protein
LAADIFRLQINGSPSTVSARSSGSFHPLQALRSTIELMYHSVQETGSSDARLN